MLSAVLLFRKYIYVLVKRSGGQGRSEKQKRDKRLKSPSLNRVVNRWNRQIDFHFGYYALLNILRFFLIQSGVSVECFFYEYTESKPNKRTRSRHIKITFFTIVYNF